MQWTTWWRRTSWLPGPEWKRSVGNIPSPSCYILSKKVLWHWPKATKLQLSLKLKPLTWVRWLLTQFALPEMLSILTCCALYSHLYVGKLGFGVIEWILMLLSFIPPPIHRIESVDFWCPWHKGQTVCFYSRRSYKSNSKTETGEGQKW